MKEDELVLAPFRPIACTRIRKRKRVCRTAWREKRTLVIPDVDAFPGHIASSLSRSEIVVPLMKEGEVWGVWISIVSYWVCSMRLIKNILNNFAGYL